MTTGPTLRTPQGNGTPPTALQGYSDYSVWGFSLTDVLEHVPSLIWPASITVYAEMRRDPQLAAVLAGITLPIRRATWAVDPTGCRPEVAQMVADDLGLPIVGMDKPGAARVRGVSWSEHLRSALLHLVFGFYGFELLADVSSGQARLVGLYERVPATIAFIHSTKTGDFGGISQILRPGNNPETPEIPADRMVWYTHEREGAAHHGTSILRPGYSSWLMKQTLRRVLAVSNERFGTGVPTVEWAPGFTPTPEQMAAAQQAASAARVGSTAGVAMPPGARLVLTGLSGGVPNTIEALRWVDQQMSGMVLSRWMDLGSSQTGSRALGEAFIDTFLLSLQTLADSISDVATRQIAARIVGWNWGDDEPVPRVTVADVGSRHEVTADALNALMQSGALSADPQLEEWVRRTYRLPPRDPSMPWQPPKAAGSDGGAGDGSVTDHMSSVAAAAPKRPAARALRKRKQPEGQLSLPIAAAASDPDPQAVQRAWESARADVLGQWPDLAQPMVDDLATQASGAVGHGDLAALAALTVPPMVVSALAAALTAAMVGLAAESAGHVVAEAVGQGVTVRAPKDPGVDRAGQVAAVTAALIASGYASAAVRKAMQVAGPGASAVEVADAVRQTLTGMGAAEAGMVADNVGAGLSAAQNAGRFAVFAAAKTKPKHWVGVETLDTNTCVNCRDAAGKIYQTFAEVEAAYPVAGLATCLGGPRCRGYAHAVWK